MARGSQKQTKGAGDSGRLYQPQADDLFKLPAEGMVQTQKTAEQISLKEKKEVYCITQNEESCVVYGMPRTVELNGLSDVSAPLKEIAKIISNKLGG